MSLHKVNYTSDKYEVRVVPIEKFLDDDYYKEVHCQRDQKRRYTAAKKYLNELVEEHFNITLVRYRGEPDGYYEPNKCYIVDGNTRRYHWQQCVEKDDGEIPAEVRVTIYEETNAESIRQRYYRYDSSDAVEKTTHKLQGALNAHSITLHSTGLKNGTFTMALRIATPGVDDLFDKVACAKHALLEADKIPNIGKVGSVRLGFAIALIRYYSAHNTTRTYDHEQYVQVIDGITKMCAMYCVNTSQEKDGITWITREWEVDQYVQNKGTGVTKLPEQLAYLTYFFDQWLLGNLRSRYSAVSAMREYKKFNSNLRSM